MSKTPRNYWPAVLIAIPFSAVLFGMLMLYLASNQQVSLVKKDYYQYGRSINQNLKPYEHANQLGLRAVLSLVNQKLAIELFSNKPDWQAPEQLTIELDHATLADRDFALVLPKDEVDQSYSVQLPGNSLVQLRGKWYLYLTNAQQGWAIRQPVLFPLPQAQVSLFAGEL